MRDRLPRGRVYYRAPDSWHYQVCRSGTQRRWLGAEHDDGSPADDHIDHAVRNVRIRRQGGRHLDRRRNQTSYLRRSGPPGRPAGQRAARPGRRRGPAGRHLHVEQRRAPRGLPGDPLDGRGAAHAQHQARGGRGRLHRHPRRRPGGHRGRLAGAQARRDPAECPDRQARDRDRRPSGRDARDRPAHRRERAPLRRPARRRGGRVRLAVDRRALRRGDVLHQRDHRTPEGHRLQPPVQLPALDGRIVCCPWCPCSTPTPGGWPTPACCPGLP